LVNLRTETVLEVCGSTGETTADTVELADVGMSTGCFWLGWGFVAHLKRSVEKYRAAQQAKENVLRKLQPWKEALEFRIT
jgi:hypothetical protein